MTDAEIAEDLERVFGEIPGMRKCYETWRGIEERICLSDGVPPLSEARCQRAFHRMLCATERRVLEAQARAQRGMAGEALADMAAEALAAGKLLPPPPIQKSIPWHPAQTPMRRAVSTPPPPIPKTVARQDIKGIPFD